MTVREVRTIKRVFVTLPNEDIAKAFSPDGDLSLWDVEVKQGQVTFTFGRVESLESETVGVPCVL